MFYFKVSRLSDDRDDIETYRDIDLKESDISICGSHRMFDFLSVYRFFGLHDVGIAPGFHFNYNQLVIFVRRQFFSYRWV